MSETLVRGNEPGERREITLEVVNLGGGTWERDWLWLYVEEADWTTRAFLPDRSEYWKAAREFQPRIGAGGMEQCAGPLRTVGLTFLLEAPEDPGCSEEEDRCLRHLQFKARANVWPEPWRYYPADILEFDVELVDE